ncbi:MAG: PqqD family peptide modification chaperone [Proteobacteria bacterium]|nr:PqqD family peptide modification chaperone [Pseudomonadota bacterium]MBU1057447.1 PqqD family peptide modification chaperone [Pseudomonadota bacterium]
MSLYSSYWYRVADITPRLRSHIRLHRHIYRGRNWYILQDPSSNRQHRFNKTAYAVIALMDGKRTVREIWNASTAALGDETPTQDEVIRLLAQLHSSDVLQSDIPPDILEIFQRQDKQGAKWKQRLTNPFALRFPLLDPDRFLLKWLPLIKPLFGRTGILVWLLVVGAAVVLAVLHWPELTRNMADKVLTPKNLLLLWLVYPVLKGLHELGHAFATRLWGGEVHEMGIMLLALTPIPYVEASASAAFSNKGRRMAVAAAGMATELFIAALALFLWLSIESGLLSAIAYNIMLIGGVSTLLFNGNPLLRFDGYYILADWIEVPNLAKRSSRYLGYLLQRYLFGIEDAVSPVTAPGEQAWFIGYGIASFFYRLFVLTALALFVSSKFFFIGILIALWAICTQIILPSIRHSYSFYNSIGGRRKRTRILAASLAIAVGTTILFFVVPAPLRTTAQGVVSLPEYSRVRAGTDCFITEILVQDGSMVQRGEPLLRCVDPFLESEVQILAANLVEAEARYNAEPLQSRVRREILHTEMASVKADLSRAHERKDELTIHSPNQGLFILPEARNLPGRFVEQGALLGYIMGASESTVLVVVSQSDIALVRERTRHVSLRLAGRLGTPLTATINREIPAASGTLPSAVLGSTGGGNIPVNPADPHGLQTLTKTFQFEIKLPLQKEALRIGERAYVLFDHGYEPIALQWLRSLRQLFLRQFHV